MGSRAAKSSTKVACQRLKVADVPLEPWHQLIGCSSAPKAFEGLLQIANPELLLADHTHGEMIPHEDPGSLADIQCDFPFIRLKAEPASQ
ncbi:uncharacterized LOC127903862 homolog [Ochotona princeps]|uniref:uncharacterized LOC127903862 homolog n=1 Tax=Ochotona princeps TaxID=9978 RepID=UPI002714820D|nr:uncharacterized LOC127903862 homolog [Ochotona princeps]